ncbi:hypothetical protein LtaPh_3221100 [Leishmania tarentolae]|uniref:Uncharacterized protein n=1 Tax=Leishmania tarentolae TaxID=5689 RepID=A0A640KVG2_LEITA|nr:hypothetical protein LtaPh_3221100 [Leishmania tarentolae]
MERRRHPDTVSVTKRTAVCCESSTSLHDQVNSDAGPTNNLASCLRRESSMAEARPGTEGEEVAVIANPCGFAKDSTSLLPTLPSRTEGAVTGAANNDCDAMQMWSDLEDPLPPNASRIGALGVLRIRPSEEEHKNEVMQATVVAQPVSTPIPVPSTGTASSTLQKGCMASSSSDTWQGVVAKTDILSLSFPSFTSAAPSQLNQLPRAGLIRCHSTPALRKVENRHRVQVLTSSPEEEVNLHRPTAARAATLTLASPASRHRDECLPMHVPHEGNVSSSSGSRASRLRALSNISGPIREEVAAVAMAGVGSRELSYCSPNSSIVTFIDHELDISTTDSGVFHAGDGLHDASGAESLLDSESGRRRSSRKHYLLTNARSPLLSGAHVRSLMPKSAARHRRLPTVVTAASQPAHRTSEYVAAVQAAAKHGRSLRQILSRCCDADDALQDSGESLSDLQEGEQGRNTA